jgi:hypothetical protein
MSFEEAIAALALNEPQSGEKILELPKKELQDGFSRLILEGIIPAIRTKYSNYQFAVVRDLLTKISETWPPRVYKVKNLTSTSIFPKNLSFTSIFPKNS